MKRFYRVKNNNSKIFLHCLILVIILDIFLFNSYIKILGENVNNIAKLKIEELTKYYLNNSIKKYLNIDTNNYIKLTINNNDVISVDIDNANANKLLNNIINDLNSNVKKIEKGKINKYHNLEMLRGSNGILLFVPIGVLFNNTLLSNIGPSIPVKINFLENIDAYIDVKVNSYGINNALIKVYVIISIEEIFETPIDKNNKKEEYSFLISSKIVNGIVPDFYGGLLEKNSEIVKNIVK